MQYVDIIPVLSNQFPSIFKHNAMLVNQFLFSFLQSLPDKEGKKCLFLVKCSDKSFEISASDKKKKQEWIQGGKCIRLL